MLKFQMSSTASNQDIHTLKGIIMSSEQYSGGDDRDNRDVNKANSVMRGIFGLIMIIVYVGMGVLLLINFFNWGGDWAWTRYVVGIVLIIYGLWRAYRQVNGID